MLATTPTSSSSRGSESPLSTPPSLSALKPVEVRPSRGVSSSPTALLHVERIEIAKAMAQEGILAKNQCYMLNVYFAGEEKIDKTRCIGLNRTNQLDTNNADIQVVHTVSQFCSLRNSVHSCVQTGHQGSRCEFCERLSRLMTFGDGRALPFANMAYNIAADASALLTTFLSHLLLESQNALESRQGSGCRGQHQLPRLLHAFLLRSPQQL